MRRASVAKQGASFLLSEADSKSHLILRRQPLEWSGGANPIKSMQ